MRVRVVVDAVVSVAEEVTSRLEPLVSPYGVVAEVRPGRLARGLDRLFVRSAPLGRGQPVAESRKRVVGTGRTHKGADLARMIAIAEGAERYAAGDFPGRPWVWAKAAELDGAVLDPGRYPRCSSTEYAREECPIVPFDADARIRWAHGFDLVSGEPMWLPAAMTCYRLRRLKPAERFAYRLSTGHAVHTDPVEAVIRGICEVVERDAIALVWLQRLPLPLIGPETWSDTVRYLSDWGERHFIHSYLLDATTDIGVPTVYCLQSAPHDTRARYVVGCGTGRDMREAAEKSLTEAVTTRSLFYSGDKIPDRYEDFLNVSDGARYMGAPERAEAFEFLLDGIERRQPVRRGSVPHDPDEALAWLIAVFAERDMPVVVVDHTTSELAEVGLTAVSVVIPDLLPMTLLPLVQFRGHPRLYDAPARMGYRVLDEEELNPWPQPFA